MSWATWTASADRDVLTAAAEVWADPWGRAKLFDAYFAFLVAWIWIAWRERGGVRAAACCWETSPSRRIFCGLSSGSTTGRGPESFPSGRPGEPCREPVSGAPGAKPPARHRHPLRHPQTAASAFAGGDRGPLTLSKRRREIGVRVALGAGTRQVVSVVLGASVRHVALGTILGGGLASALLRVKGQLFVTRLPDGEPWRLPAVIAAFAFAATAAYSTPARRALDIPPSEALRSD